MATRFLLTALTAASLVLASALASGAEPTPTLEKTGTMVHLSFFSVGSGQTKTTTALCEVTRASATPVSCSRPFVSKATFLGDTDMRTDIDGVTTLSSPRCGHPTVRLTSTTPNKFEVHITNDSVEKVVMIKRSTFSSTVLHGAGTIMACGSTNDELLIISEFY